MKAATRTSLLFALFLTVAGFFTACSSSQKEKSGGKIRAVWFSYLEYAELCSQMDRKEFTDFAKEAASNLCDAGFNTVYVQAVAFTDALYDSSVYPPSSYLPCLKTETSASREKPGQGGIRTGVGFGIGFGKGGWTRTGVGVSIGMEGRAGNYPEEGQKRSWPKPDYDPLKILISQMKKKNIAVHAWINPMRSVREEEMQNLPDDFIVKKWAKEKNGRLFLYKGRYYLNPCYSDVLRLICRGVGELAQNYDISGIHIDDYFYPNGATEEIDEKEFEKAKQKHPSLTLRQFRTVNVDTMVKQIYAAVKKEDSNLVFGISPSGNLQSCRNLLFADPAHWIKQKSVDYLAPQIYWGFLHPAKPFEKTLTEWKELTSGSDVKLIAGLAAYKVGSAENTGSLEADSEWQKSSRVLADQALLSDRKGYEGIACFRYKSLFSPSPLESAHAEKELSALKAVLTN